MYIESDSKRSKLRVEFFSLFLMKKTTFQWSEVVSEDLFPINWGYSEEVLDFRFGH